MARIADFEAVRMGIPTNAPAVGPTMPPGFNLESFAQKSVEEATILAPETVLELVPDVSWTCSNLDLIEMNVIGHIDGISPISLLQTMLGISGDDLQVMLVMMLARQLVRVVQGRREEPSSGVFSCAAAVSDEDEAFAKAG